MRMTLTWPLRDIIYPAKLLDTNIGIFGWIGEEQKKIYVPVTVLPTHAPLLEEDTDIHLYFQASGAVFELVKWRSSDNVEGVCSGLSERIWHDLPLPSNQHQRPFHIILPSSSSGTLCLEIAAKSQRTKTWGKKQIHVIVSSTRQ